MLLVDIIRINIVIDTHIILLIIKWIVWKEFPHLPRRRVVALRWRVKGKTLIVLIIDKRFGADKKIIDFTHERYTLFFFMWSRTPPLLTSLYLYKIELFFSSKLDIKIIIAISHREFNLKWNPVYSVWRKLLMIARDDISGKKFSVYTVILFYFGNDARINVEKCCVNLGNFVAFQFQQRHCLVFFLHNRVLWCHKNLKRNIWFVISVSLVGFNMPKQFFFSSTHCCVLYKTLIPKHQLKTWQDNRNLSHISLTLMQKWKHLYFTNGMQCLIRHKV